MWMRNGDEGPVLGRRVSSSRQRPSSVWGVATGVATAFLALACDDGGASGSGGSTSSSTATSTAMGSTTSAGSTASSTGTGAGTGGGTPVEAAAFVRGDLFTADIATAMALHDMIAGGGETQAKAAGDFAHDPFLGTSLLGTKPDQFLAIDRWSSDENMDAFYANPDFQAAFGQLFSAPPEFETFLRTDLYQWGSLDAADASSPHFFVVVRGKLKSLPAQVKAEHDAIAMAGEPQVTAAGDVAHVVYAGRQDPHEALIVDVWTSSDNILAVYSDPNFQMAVGGLFAAPPAVGVYTSTDWHGW